MFPCHILPNWRPCLSYQLAEWWSKRCQWTLSILRAVFPLDGRMGRSETCHLRKFPLCVRGRSSGRSLQPPDLAALRCVLLAQWRRPGAHMAISETAWQIQGISAWAGCPQGSPSPSPAVPGASAGAAEPGAPIRLLLGQQNNAGCNLHHQLQERGEGNL